MYLLSNTPCNFVYLSFTACRGLYTYFWSPTWVWTHEVQVYTQVIYMHGNEHFNAEVYVTYILPTTAEYFILVPQSIGRKDEENSPTEISSSRNKHPKLKKQMSAPSRIGSSFRLKRKRSKRDYKEELHNSNEHSTQNIPEKLVCLLVHNCNMLKNMKICC